MSALTETSTGASPSPGATAPAALAVAVLGLGQDAAAYEMFDVVSLDVAGARLAGPLLLEIGEELTLRLSRGATSVQLRARITGHSRGERGMVSAVDFVEPGAAERVRAVVDAG
ncbi:MAG: hypothetical protein H6709_19810 [Kofleriaceae bacterium]|nr:hypothetical protein [Kofleriaceae bacterium]MCB9574332.1 hypothetical protein [Kofleriaceae bacterium]